MKKEQYEQFALLASLMWLASLSLWLIGFLNPNNWLMLAFLAVAVAGMMLILILREGAFILFPLVIPAMLMGWLIVFPIHFVCELFSGDMQKPYDRTWRRCD